MRKTKILCVEDHADSAELVVFLLGQYEVTVATCISEAMTFAANGCFDLFLFDYHLPDGNGVELLASLREVDEKALVVFMTASTRLSRNEARRLGAVDLLNKGCVSFTSDLVDLVGRTIPASIPESSPPAPN